MSKDGPEDDGQVVPPEAVVPPPETPRAVRVQPTHLYKSVALLFLFALLFHYLPQIVETLLLAYAAIVLAVAFNAIVQAIPGRRGWVTGLLGLLILGTVAGLLWVGVPLLLGEVRSLASQIPTLQVELEAAQAWIEANTSLNVNLVGPETRQFLSSMFLNSGVGSTLLARAQGLLGMLLIPLLILFGALYAAGRPNEQLLSGVMRVVPRRYRLAFRRILQLLGDRILGYVRGVLMGMLFVGVLSYAAYGIIGVPNSLLLGLIAGLTEAIPLLGPWIGGGIAVIAAFLTDPARALWTAVAAVVIQQIENHLLIPFVMSAEAEVHPFVTLFSLVLFGSMFGFLGVLLSIPIVLLVATIVEVLWVERAIDTDQDPIAPVVEE
jgi:predicted PurR-regulated permease PerM